jgi:hypothetical protein
VAFFLVVLLMMIWPALAAAGVVNVSITARLALPDGVPSVFRDRDRNAGLVKNGANEEVTATGDVLYTNNDTSIVRWQNGGGVTPVTNDGLTDIYPLFDGANLVYATEDTGASTFSTSLLLADGGLVVLDPNDPRLPNPGQDYQINAGWVAYTAPSGGAEQMFRRAPDGTTTRLTSYGSGASGGLPIEVLLMDSAGDIFFQGIDNRYFATPDAGPVVDNTTHLVSGNRWYAVAGGALLRTPTRTRMRASASGKWSTPVKHSAADPPGTTRRLRDTAEWTRRRARRPSTMLRAAATPAERLGGAPALAGLLFAAFAIRRRAGSRDRGRPRRGVCA